MNSAPENDPHAQDLMPAYDLHPDLQEIVQASGINPKKIALAFNLKDKRPDLTARSEIWLQDGNQKALWRVPSLRALFRGNKQPPSMSGEPPPEYLPVYFFIETHVIAYCDIVGDQTDAQFEDAFANLRRRPDGKSLNEMHFCLWQVMALATGIYPFSAAEFEAIAGRLALSAAHFKMGLVSRNYIETLRATVIR
jgi:hypothetical protein